MMKLLGLPYVKPHWWYWWLAKRSIIVYVISHWICGGAWEKASGPRWVMRFMAIQAVDITCLFTCCQRAIGVSSCERLFEFCSCLFKLILWVSSWIFYPLCPVCLPIFLTPTLSFSNPLCHKLVTGDSATEGKPIYRAFFIWRQYRVPLGILFGRLQEGPKWSHANLQALISVVLSLCHLVFFIWMGNLYKKTLSLCISLCNSQASLFFSLQGFY